MCAVGTSLLRCACEVPTWWRERGAGAAPWSTWPEDKAFLHCVCRRLTYQTGVVKLAGTSKALPPIPSMACLSWGTIGGPSVGGGVPTLLLVSLSGVIPVEPEPARLANQMLALIPPEARVDCCRLAEGLVITQPGGALHLSV